MRVAAWFWERTLLSSATKDSLESSSPRRPSSAASLAGPERLSTALMPVASLRMAVRSTALTRSLVVRVIRPLGWISFSAFPLAGTRGSTVSKLSRDGDAAGDDAIAVLDVAGAGGVGVEHGGLGVEEDFDGSLGLGKGAKGCVAGGVFEDGQFDGDVAFELVEAVIERRALDRIDGYREGVIGGYAKGCGGDVDAAGAEEDGHGDGHGVAIEAGEEDEGGVEAGGPLAAVGGCDEVADGVGEVFGFEVGDLQTIAALDCFGGFERQG